MRSQPGAGSGVRRARRVRRREALGKDFVHRGKVGHVGEQERQLDDVVERPTRCLGHRLQVGDYLPRLRLEPVAEIAGRRVEADLPGQIHGVTRADCLRVRTDRGGGVAGLDRVLAHAASESIRRQI
jgi:hypothetical protein